MIVRTRQTLTHPASAVWPLLCESQMDGTPPGFGSRLGLPRPVRCHLPDGHGGVGSERECVSDRGRVRQRILEWDPPKRLSFRMEQTDLSQLRPVDRLIDTFDLEESSAGTRVVRTTHVGFRAPVAPWTRALLFLGLRRVHRYVFRNWTRLLDTDPRARSLGADARSRPSS